MAGTGLNATYIDATCFTVALDRTQTFIVGRRVKADCGVDGYKFGTIESSVSDGTSTTVCLTASSDDLTSNLNVVWYGIVGGGANDQSMPIHNHDGSEGSGGFLNTECCVGVEDEGVALSGSPFNTINFIGDGVTATDSTSDENTVDVTIPGGSDGVGVYDDGVEVDGSPFENINFQGDNISVDSTSNVSNAVDVQVIFGQEYAYNSSDGESSTSSTTPVEKVSLSLTNLPSGTYHIEYSMEFSVDNDKDSDFQAQVQIDDTTTIARYGEGTAWKIDNGIWVGQSGFYDAVLSGNVDIDMDYWDTAGIGVNIRRARLVAWRVA